MTANGALLPVAPGATFGRSCPRTCRSLYPSGSAQLVGSCHIIRSPAIGCGLAAPRTRRDGRRRMWSRSGADTTRASTLRA